MKNNQISVRLSCKSAETLFQNAALLSIHALHLSSLFDSIKKLSNSNCSSLFDSNKYIYNVIYIVVMFFQTEFWTYSIKDFNWIASSQSCSLSPSLFFSLISALTGFRPAALSKGCRRLFYPELYTFSLQRRDFFMLNSDRRWGPKIVFHAPLW